MILFATWAALLILCSPVAFLFGTKKETYFSGLDTTICSFLYTESEYRISYSIVFFTIAYVIPLLLITLPYTLVIKRIFSRKMIKNEEKQLRVTKIITIVIVAFVCCWTPINVIFILKSFEFFPINDTAVRIQVFAQTLAYLNSCVNPILYGFLSPSFRLAFKNVLTFSWCSQPYMEDLLVVQFSSKRPVEGRIHTVFP